MSYRDIFTNPVQFNGFNPDSIIEANIVKDPLFSTWFSFTDRYISFAAKVAALLEIRYPGVFNFQYYDVGKHRIIYYKNIDIFIDFSSAVGSIVLKENQEWTNLNNVNRR